MICGSMVLVVVVGKVGGPAGPVEMKLGLGLPAAEPMEAEPNHFGAPLNDGVVEETSGGRIVSLDWRGRLRPTHFQEGVMERDHFSSCVVESTEFGFSS